MSNLLNFYLDPTDLKTSYEDTRIKDIFYSGIEAMECIHPQHDRIHAA